MASLPSDAEPNNAALFDARRRQHNAGTSVLDDIVSGSNCMFEFNAEHVSSKGIGGARAKDWK